ncbi:hypothetical protein BV898_07128 [Hypsibius exemplaris]|uniref:Adenylosuccinate lyase n=1 Tax=Hypsibius exemplaris TaxID=2072580 RepID=A0A1W0WUK2_HYPEX|nr:hypothetical protein BV898_07128 [Hypsibius exemplaris]
MASNNNDKEKNKYQSPLTQRYASEEMAYNFSERKRIITWRKLWIWLAKAQQVRDSYILPAPAVNNLVGR